MSDLKARIEQLRHTILDSTDGGLNYMENMDNWVCVHVTKYEPKLDDKGQPFIQTTAMATDNTLPRASVHVTLNKVVSSHMGGNWDAAPIVVLAPYRDIVRENGNPQEISVDDTYFIADPDKGLLLPDSTYIIRGDPNADKLFDISEHGATYKTDHYTPEEVDEILSISNWDRDTYEKYMQGDVPESNVEWLLGFDKKLMWTYEQSKDKKAFLRGILEEDRFVILNKLLRDEVVQMGLEKMGYNYVWSHEDAVSDRVADIAREHGIRGCGNDKGHSCSMESDMEIVGCQLTNLVDVLKSKDAEKIGQYLKNSEWAPCKEVALNITEDKPLPDFYEIYQSVLEERIELEKRQAEYDEQGKDEHLADAQKLEKGGIKAYHSFLDVVLRRHAKKMNDEAAKALNDLKQNPKEYAKLQQYLKNGNEKFEILDYLVKRGMGRL